MLHIPLGKLLSTMGHVPHAQTQTHYQDFKYLETSTVLNIIFPRRPYTWKEAHQMAQNTSGHMVAISSKEENDYIASRVRSLSVFIGLTDYKKEGDFVWSNGESLTYTNWFYNQPNDTEGGQDNVEMLKDGTWNGCWRQVFILYSRSALSIC